MFLPIVYCFAPIAGFSAFGSYVGNGQLMVDLFTQDSDQDGSC